MNWNSGFGPLVTISSRPEQSAVWIPAASGPRRPRIWITLSAGSPISLLASQDLVQVGGFDAENVQSFAALVVAEVVEFLRKELPPKEGDQNVVWNAHRGLREDRGNLHVRLLQKKEPLGPRH